MQESAGDNMIHQIHYFSSDFHGATQVLRLKTPKTEIKAIRGSKYQSSMSSVAQIIHVLLLAPIILAGRKKDSEMRSWGSMLHKK